MLPPIDSTRYSPADDSTLEPDTANKQANTSPDGGDRLKGFGEIPSHHGELPSPLPALYYVPQDMGELTKLYYEPHEIRQWVRESAEYHGVPYELSAAILQQENPPEATGLQQLGQFGERSITSAAAVIDEYVWDIAPDAIAEGSSGLANMNRATLRGAADYVENDLGYQAVPHDVQNRVFGLQQNSRISGDDWRNDLYYMNARLRQIIDDKTGIKGYDGPLTRAQVQEIAATYNGTGTDAEKYGNDTVARLDQAAAGSVPLYFFSRA
jgi:hypothetical protein